MNQKVLFSSLLVSGTIIMGVTTASAGELPVFATSDCSIAVAARPGAACGNVERLATLDSVTLITAADDGQVLADSRRVVAVLGLRGPEVLRLDQPDIPTGSIKPAR